MCAVVEKMVAQKHTKDRLILDEMGEKNQIVPDFSRID
jgi:hypothetical protein